MRVTKKPKLICLPSTPRVHQFYRILISHSDSSTNFFPFADRVVMGHVIDDRMLSPSGATVRAGIHASLGTFGTLYKLCDVFLRHFFDQKRLVVPLPPILYPKICHVHNVGTLSRTAREEKESLLPLRKVEAALRLA